MKHKFLVVFLAIVAALCMAFGLAACGGKIDETGNNPSGNEQGGAQKPENSNTGLEFTVNDYGTYSVTGIGECKDAEIIIPSEYEGKPVTAIKKEAFKGNLFITKVVIGNNVTTIGENAFLECALLKNITMPDGIKSIGKNAFYNTAIYDYESSWNRDVLYIGKYLIQAKSEISGQCAVKPGTLLIADYAFYKCGELTSIALPDDMISIGTRAFYGCSKLSSIDIPDSVTSIGTYAFYNTAYFNSYDYWTNDVLYIGNHLIASKDTISGSYSINTGTKTIADRAFYYCDELTSVTIPDSVTSIGVKAFDYCSGLTELKVSPDNQTYHSKNNCLIETKSKILIAGCKTSEIPDDGNVTSIEEGAFDRVRDTTAKSKILSKQPLSRA